MIDNAIHIIFAFGLFFAGLIGLGQYSATFSNKRLKLRASKTSKFTSFLKGLGITAIAADGGRIITFTNATLASSGLISFSYASIAVLGATCAESSASFLVLLRGTIIFFTLIGVGGIASFFLRKTTHVYLKATCLFLFYLGLILFGMHEIESGFSFLGKSHFIYSFFMAKHALILYAIMGCILSIVLQSAGAVTFLTIALFRAGLFDHSQAILILYGGTFGSAVRTQLLALLFEGSGRQLVSFLAHLKVSIAILLFLDFIFDKYLGIHLVGYYIFSLWNNLAFQYATTATVMACISALLASLVIPKLAKLYTKLHPLPDHEKISKTKFIGNLTQVPIEDWYELILKEYNHLLAEISKNINLFTNKSLNRFKLARCYKSTKVVIQYMLESLKELYSNVDNNHPIKYAAYERIIILNSLNEELHKFIELAHDAEKRDLDKIVKITSHHIHFVLMELTDCTIFPLSKSKLKASYQRIENYSSRRQILYKHLDETNPDNNSLIIRIIGIYNDIIFSSRKLFESYLNEIE